MGCGGSSDEISIEDDPSKVRGLFPAACIYCSHVPFHVDSWRNFSAASWPRGLSFDTVAVVVCGSLQMKYFPCMPRVVGAEATHIGWNSLKKENQDRTLYIPSFADNPTMVLAAVFDGHGQDGMAGAYTVSGATSATRYAVACLY